jgi:hypothetical protein
MQFSSIFSSAPCSQTPPKFIKNTFGKYVLYR